MSTAAVAAGRDLARASIIARAAAAGVLAVVVALTRDNGHAADFGLLVFGSFSIVQGVLVTAGATALPPARRRLAVVAGGLGIVVGIVAIAGVSLGFALLLPLAAVSFVCLGALETVGGLRRESAAPSSRDQVVIGVITAFVGLLLLVVDSDSVFVIGVVGAWGAIVAVYLGIAAASPVRSESAASAGSDGDVR